MPRNADGTPNLKAPTPRLPDGKPDFSGIWHAGEPAPVRARHGRIHRLRQRDRRLQAVARTRRGPARRPAVSAVGARAAYTSANADDSRDDPHVRCLPDNPPRHWNLPHLTRAIHTPKLLALLYEVNADVPADPHRRPAAARRIRRRAGWATRRPAGRATRWCVADRGLPRRPVDRRHRQPDGLWPPR